MQDVHECNIIFCNSIKITQTCGCKQSHKRVYVVMKLTIKISDALRQFESIYSQLVTRIQSVFAFLKMASLQPKLQSEMFKMLQHLPTQCLLLF